MTYRADIDGLRTIAILLVLIFHFDLFEIGKAGFIGVDVFFVISGFLITSIIRRDLESGQFHFGDFLYRRIRRLYPALIATLALTLCAGWFLFLPYRFEQLASQSLLSLVYAINFHFWQNVNYFGLRAVDAPLLHMWSLAVEEQFYFFFPLFCLAVWRFAPRFLLPSVVVATVLSFSLGVVFSSWKPEAAFYLLPTRAWELMVGAILALVLHNRSAAGRWLLWSGPLGGILIIAAVVTYGPLTPVPGWFALLPTFGALALLLSGFAAHSPLTKVLSSPVPVFIGKISYPLYLVHWPIKIFLQEHLLEFSLGWRVCGFLLSFLFAAGIYYLIEMPVRHKKVLKSKFGFLLTAAGLTAGCMAFSAAILKTDGAIGRFPDAVAQVLEFQDDLPKQFENCTLRGTKVKDLCSIGKGPSERTTLVIGDSHAYAFAGAIDLWLTETGRQGALAFRIGCMPVLKFGGKGCRSTNEATIAFAETTPEITDVVLVSLWRQGLPDGGREVNGVWVAENDVAQVFSDQLSKTVGRLVAAGKNVTIIEPMFNAPTDLPKAVADRIAFGRQQDLNLPLTEYHETFSTIFAAFDALEPTSVQRVSLIEPFCGGGICQTIVDGMPLFTDTNHFANTHRQKVADVLIGQQ